METEYTNPGSDHLPSLGAQLVAGRENLGISLRDAAEKLQLLPQQVEALEKNQFDYFKADIYVKGHIRSYAKMINKNPDQLITLFENKYSRPEPTLHVANKPQMSQRTIGKPKSQNRMMPIIIGLLALLIVAFILWLALKEELQPAQNNEGDALTPIVVDPVDSNLVDRLVDQNKKQQESAEAVVNVSVDNRSIAEQFSGAVVVNNNQQPAVKPIQQEEPKAQTVQLDKPVQQKENAKGTSLNLTLIDNCWLKVSDSEGKVLAIGMKSAGNQLTLQGKPPYKLILGNATAVNATYQGESVKITPNPRNNSARFSIGEAGDY